MRLTHVLLTLAALLGATRARAQTCPDVAGFPSSWPSVASSIVKANGETDRDIADQSQRPYADGLEQKLYLLSEQAAEASRAPGLTPAQVAALTRLVSFVKVGLQRYDPSDPRTGRWLAASDVKPRACTSAGVDPATFLPIAPDCKWEIFNDPALRVPAATAPDAWPCPFEATFGGYVRSAYELLAARGDPLVKKAAASLQHYDQAWQNLITGGYSQFPWEVALNGLWIHEDHWGPSPNFAVFLHPAVGAGVANINHRDGEAVAAAMLSVEALGYLRYFRNHKHYVGGSLTGTLGNLQWSQKALGGVVHLSGFSLGASRGFTGANDGEWTLFWLVDVGRSMDDNLLTKKIPKAITDHYLP
jgi:hypothetical protein